MRAWSGPAYEALKEETRRASEARDDRSRLLDDLDRERWPRMGRGCIPFDWYDPARHDAYPHDEVMAVYRFERATWQGGHPERLTGWGQWHAWAKEEARRNRAVVAAAAPTAATPIAGGGER